MPPDPDGVKSGGKDKSCDHFASHTAQYAHAHIPSLPTDFIPITAAVNALAADLLLGAEYEFVPEYLQQNRDRFGPSA
jgi:hypothetical protein